MLKRNNGGLSLSKDRAVEIAREFLKKQDFSRHYHFESPVVYIEEDAYMVEFRDHDEEIEPGVCIISVHRTSGKAEHVPVE